ncbi:MAG TPA: sialidase family protein [Nakamurella sp.]
MTRHTAGIRAVVLLAVATLLTTTAGTVAAASPPAAVSPNLSLFATAGCLALDNQAGSLNYLNSEVEPQVAIDPIDPSHLVGAWQQDRWSDGGAHGLVAGFSTDGGAHWAVSPQPFTACYHASGYPGAFLNYQRASDPWVSIGPGAPPGSQAGSTVYSVSISFDQTPFPGDPNAVKNAIGAAASYDGGATWSNVQTIIADPCIQGTPSGPGYQCNNTRSSLFNDKQSVTADPLHPGVAYAVWDRLVNPPASPRGFQRERAYFGPALLSKTTDFGKTWSTPRVIVGTPSQQQTIGNQIVMDRRNGDLYDFFNLIQNTSNAGGNRGFNVAFVKSTDAGATWSRPTVVASLQTAGVSDPNNPDPLTGTPPAGSRTGDIIPEPAINPSTGQLYVTWQDSRFNGFSNDEVVVSTSSNGGAAWSPPALVNEHTGQPAYDPSVSVNAAGVLAVSYFQWAATSPGQEPTTLRIRHSTSPGSSATGPTFDAATVLDGPFNNLAAPVSQGYFLGDYQGLVAGPSGFLPFYVKTNCADGNATTQPSCRAIGSVLSPTDVSPTGNDATGVYAITGG